MSTAARIELEALTRRYCGTFGVEHDAVVILEMHDDRYAIAVPGLPVWTTSGKAPKWFVDDMKRSESCPS